MNDSEEPTSSPGFRTVTDSEHKTNSANRKPRFPEPWRAVVSAAGYLVLILSYAPILWLPIMSLSERPLSGVPGAFTTEWFQRLFADSQVFSALRLSVLLGIMVGVTCALGATLLGRELAQMRSRTVRGRLLSAALLPLFVPSVVVGTAEFLYFRTLDLDLGLWSLFVGHLVWAFPFSLLAVLVVASRFDTRLAEAGADLGATPWQVFRYVEWPALRAGIIASGLFGFLLSFNELSRSIFLRGGETTLPLFVWAQASSHTSSVPLVYALSATVLVTSSILIGGAFWALFGRE